MIKLLSIVVCFTRISVVWAKNPLTRRVLITLSQLALTTIILIKNERKQNRAIGSNRGTIDGNPNDSKIPIGASNPE